MINQLQSCHVFAPATTSNLAVGFDILGFPLIGIGDELILRKNNTNTLNIKEIINGDGIPIALEKNTASVAILAMCLALGIKQGFDIP